MNRTTTQRIVSRYLVALPRKCAVEEPAAPRGVILS